MERRTLMRKLISFRAMAAAAALFILAACGSSAVTTAPSGATHTPSATAPAAGQAAATEQAAPAPSGAGVTVRLGYFPNLTHAPAVVGVARGTFKDALGANATLDVKTFNAGPALIEALFAGEIDLGYIGPNPAINGYVKSKGDALRVVAGAASGGALFIVRPESNIASGKDLDGKKIASPQLGGTQDVALRYYIQENGLQTAEKGGTVEIIPTQNADILTLFKQGAIDGAWVPEPWASRLIQEANGKVLVDERTIWPNGQFVTTHVIASRKFLSEHPDLVKAFLAAHVETVEFIKQNPDETKKIVNSELKRITGAALSDAVLEAAYKNLDITYDPLAQSLFTSADHAFALGFLGAAKPDLSGIYDLGPLNEVLKEKGLAPVAAQ
ncbi:ABC transporter substrate-binding protein [Chloroflexia bacterium SDU3-3]|nr:ABC transporter substrate-binding protein [Chloroflexia bacterium SDU3-3]